MYTRSPSPPLHSLISTLVFNSYEISSLYILESLGDATAFIEFAAFENLELLHRLNSLSLVMAAWVHSATKI